MLVAALSTGHKIGLLVMAGIFIAFALVSSFLVPRRNPGFPGRGLSVFVVVSLALFVLMIGAVEIFGVEKEEANASEAPAGAPAHGQIQVVESEWRVQLPSSTAKTLAGGAYTFRVVNHGKQPHNLAIDGPGVSNAKTPDIPPGKSADLKVTLETGTYDLYCAIPGHKQLGMDAKLKIA